MWHVKSALICEGVAPDSRGLLTLVGYEPGAVVVPAFPSQVAPISVFLLEQALGDALPEADTPVSVRTTVFAPDGTVVFLNEVQQAISAGLRNPHLPFRLQQAAQLAFIAQKEGRYTVNVDLNIGGEQVRGETGFAVLDADMMREIAQP